mgnify:CR=1 FL=1
MGRLYSYLIDPIRTIQLYTHQKDWKLWWILIFIHAIISVIKVSSLGVFSFVAHIIFSVGWLVLTAIIIDATAQLIGQKGELPSVLYWLGFANAVLWLSPSVTIIQYSFYSIGSILVFLLNIVFLYYMWTTLKKIYNINQWQLMGIFTVPIISVIVFVIAFSVYVTQMAMVLK